MLTARSIDHQIQAIAAVLAQTLQPNKERNQQTTNKKKKQGANQKTDQRKKRETNKHTRNKPLPVKF